MRSILITLLVSIRLCAYSQSSPMEQAYKKMHGNDVVSNNELDKAKFSKKPFEQAEYYESIGDLDMALEKYHEGARAGGIGGGKKFDHGFAEYFRIMPAAVEKKYRAAHNVGDLSAKFDLFMKAGEFVKMHRARWQYDDWKKKIAPDWDLYNQIFDVLVNAYLTDGEQANTRMGMESELNKLDEFINKERSIFNIGDEPNNIGVSPEGTKRIEQYKKRISEESCKEVDKIVSEAQQNYASKMFRQAYQKASEALGLIERYGCKDDRADNIMKQSVANGGILIAVFPIKGQDALRNIDKDIVSAIEGIEEPFVRALDPANLENLLLQKDITIEDTYGADIVSLIKLGKIIGFNCIVTGKILQAEAGNSTMTSKSFTALKIQEDSKGKYTDGSTAVINEYYGKRLGKYKVQLKIVDLRTKQILFSDVIEHNSVEEIHYAASSSPFSKLSNQEFEKYYEEGSTTVGSIANAIDAISIPGDVKKWQRKMIELSEQRREFVGTEKLVKEFSGKIREQVRNVIMQNYGTQ